MYAWHVAVRAPHRGAIVDIEQALAKTAKNLQVGWATGGYELPCWPLRTCPYSIVDESVRAGKPKYRLTTDLSWPPVGGVWGGDAWVDSVNGAMDRAAWP